MLRSLLIGACCIANRDNAAHGADGLGIDAAGAVAMPAQSAAEAEDVRRKLQPSIATTHH